MEMDYHELRRAYFGRAQHIGRAITDSQAERLMTPEQRKRFAARNMITDDRWQVRMLAGGALLVEVAHGRFLESPLLGLTVFCVGELRADAPTWDYSLSQVAHGVDEAIARLHVLNDGGRERIAALAACA